MKLSETALIVLNGAAQREDRLILRRRTVPPVVDVNVSRALVKQGLVEIIRAPADVSDVVIVREGDCPMAFLISDAGFRAINLEPPSSEVVGNAGGRTTPMPPGADLGRSDGPASQGVVRLPTAGTVREGDTAAPGALVARTDAPVSPAQRVPSPTTLRQAAAAVLAAWSVETDRGTALPAVLEPLMANLRSTIDGRPAWASAGQKGKPREDTKQAAVLGLLRREEGATIAQVMATTGWASHTVRGFFAGLKKKGVTVVNADRVRRTLPDEQGGAKGSYSIYRVSEEGQG